MENGTKEDSMGFDFGEMGLPDNIMPTEGAQDELSLFLSMLNGYWIQIILIRKSLLTN